MQGIADRVELRRGAARRARIWLALLAATIVVPPLGRSGGPVQKAAIRRDTYGIPHILAETEEAAAYAHGYAAAEDHLPAMARLFLRARGEQASVFGESAVAEDLLVRRIAIWETARDRFHDCPPLMQAILNAYAAGYNRYLQEQPARAPKWAAPISGIDVLAHCRAVLLIDFSLDLRPWRRPESSPGAGSNMWALGKGRTSSGHGILLANPHLKWEGSHLFHEVQITVPGRINISGAALIGYPVVTIGFNEHLGWSHTVNEHRSDDVYELTLNPDNPEEYLYDGRPLPLTARTISIQVKTENGVETRTERVLSSHYGPIIRVAGGKAYAYKSANLNSIDFLTEYNQMAKAKSLEEFRSALNMQQLPMFNVAYADDRGNVWFLYNGRIPIRPRGFRSSPAVAGDTSQTEWYAIHPLSELPQLLNPPSGYVQNCNDAPWYATLPVSIDRAKYPEYIGGEGLGMRGQMSLRMLESAKDVTLEDVKRYKYNEKLLLAERLKPELIRLARRNEGAAAELSKALETLQTWDNQAAAESRGAVLFQTWWDTYSANAKPVYKNAWNRERPLETPEGIGDENLAVSTLQKAARDLLARYHDLTVPWGEVHRLRRGELDLPIGGLNGLGAFRSIFYRRDADGKWTAAGGDGYVLAVEFTSPPTAYSIAAYSESSNPASAHYADQTTLFARHGYKPVWFTEDDIRKHLEREYRPQ